MTKPLVLTIFRRRVLLAALSGLSVLALPTHAPAAAAADVQSSERVSYVFLGPGGRDSTMSGSMVDLRRARALQAGGERLLYVRLDGADYVIRDPETLRRADAIFEPQQAMGARQAELGSRQAALGERQARLGAQQARLASRRAGMAPNRAGELGHKQGELGRQQNALGQEQNGLGRQQASLGREQARLARVAQTKLRALVDEAIRDGRAQRAN